MKILVAQLNPTIGDFKGNTAKILKSLENARLGNLEIVVFPEMTLCGYPPEDLLLHRPFIEEMEKCLGEVIKASSNLFVVVGLARFNREGGEKKLFNSAAVIHDGKLLGFHDKHLLPTYDVFDERRYFEPGHSVRLWPFKEKKIGVMICEDIWQHAGVVEYTDYKKDPVLELKKEKPDLLITIAASPYHFEKPDLRMRVCNASAKTLKCPLILCCQVGGNDQLVFDGYSAVLDEKGDLRQVAKGFKEEEMKVDLEELPPLLHFHYDAVQDLYSALVLGLRDYFYKLGFKKACIGLSGGIDSALVACLAVEALGKENVLGLSMPSRYSSPSSITDAQVLASNLGMKLETLSIEPAFESFLDLLKPVFGDKPFDITEENLQARIRGMILMAVSNKLGYIVLSTGNKSEMALGYCTIYGDMCGGLGVISDVTKGQVYALSRFINRKKEIIPRSSIEKPPSAELRANQKDIDSLPEYEIIDAVLSDYVEYFLSPEEIAKRHDFSLPLVEDLVHRIHLAEYKRRQAPPCIRVSKKAFRIGRVYPIVEKWA